MQASGSTAAPAPSTAPSSTVASTTTVPLVFTGTFANFDKALASSLIGHGDLALSVAVARNGQLIHQAAFGVANPLTGEAAKPADRFRIASNSKMLIATVIMEMVQEGTLRLDDRPLPSLAAHLGVTPSAPMGAITVRQLLSHTSGFPEYEHTFFGGGAKSCTEAAKKGLTGSVLGPAGTIYRYSNMNFCVLGLVIEQRTGQALQTVVQARVLSPLGIHDMRMAGTYDVRKGDVAHPTTPSRTFMEALGGAGAWIGTAADLVRIVDGLDTSRPGWHPLTAASVNQMLAAQPGIPYSPGQWYGLGLRVWADGTWGHTGTVENARSMVIRRPDGLTWAVVVSGNAPSNTDRLRDRVDAALATVGISPPATTLPPPPPPGAGPATTTHSTVPATVGEG
jgi:D-alanyl-D-alanine carboxypeptidase